MSSFLLSITIDQFIKSIYFLTSHQQTYFGGEEIESTIVPDVVNGAEGNQQYGFGNPVQSPQGDYGFGGGSQPLFKF